ncbi:MAG: MmcQ/YjbR family DNA-binding protein [Cyclobacteriaceae bacterium]|nr:MmcQ/YjbR family DNA-binding protein [Cyclobacteriaceae bacterium]
MVDLKTFKKLALSLPEVVEAPHFEKASFRVKKKIFVTLDVANAKACLKLTEIDQSVFSTSAAIYPVPNKWGKQGWTFIELKKVTRNLLEDALITAYCTVAPKKLVELVKTS